MSSDYYKDIEAIEIFIGESLENLDMIEPALLGIEESSGTTDGATINLIFRGIHSIKGSAGLFGFDNISDLSHVMETLMAMVRSGRVKPCKEVTSVILNGIDKLRAMLGNVSESNKVDISGEVSALKAMIKQETAPGQVADKSTGPVSSKKSEGQVDEGWELMGFKDQVLDAASRGKNLYTINMPVKPGSVKKGQALLSFKKKLDSVGTCLASEPDVFTGDGSIDLKKLAGRKKIYILLLTVLKKDHLIGFLKIDHENVSAIDVTELKGKAPVVEESAVSEDAPEEKPAPIREYDAVRDEDTAEKDSSPEMVRIKVDLLEQLMTLTSELVFGRNQLLHAYSDSGVNGILRVHSQRVTELQDSVMKTRLQPISSLFYKFRRIVRDLAMKVEKEIGLTLEGEDIELDRKILEGLTAPLTHLVRNSADHGLERPEERERLGKSRCGNIHLRAVHHGGSVMVEVEDDGRGIDWKGVVQSALKNGTINEDEAKRMGEKDALNLIFQPGFSTASRVSDLSGRGVGMDVVRTNIEKLRGAIDLVTRPGEGTCVTIRFPLTLAIVPALLVTVEDCRFVIPRADVLEVVRYQETGVSRIETVQGQTVLRLRGRLLPVIRLSDVLGVRRTYRSRKTGRVEIDRRVRLEDRRSGDKSDAATGKMRTGKDRRRALVTRRIVVLRCGRNSYGLLVDAILDTEEVVVKPLPELMKSNPEFSATTITGDGRVAMILNPEGMAGKAGLNFKKVDNKNDELRDEGITKPVAAPENIVVFSNAEEEYFSLPLSRIARVERVGDGMIEKRGNKEFARIRDRSVYLIRLEDYINVSSGGWDGSSSYVVIPKNVNHSAGVVIKKIEDVVDTVADVEAGSRKEEGVLGTLTVNNRLTCFLDMDSILDMAGIERSASVERPF